MGPLDRLRYHVTGAIERGEAMAILEQAIDHPDSTRYCYTCQTWLTSAKELPGHETHSIH